MPAQAALDRTIETALTCNCLLSITSSEEAADPKTSREQQGCPNLFSACYSLDKAAGPGGEASYTGCVELYRGSEPRRVAAGRETSTSPSPLFWSHEREQRGLPGVFDVTTVASRWFPQTSLAEEERLPRRLLLIACTDGGARLVSPTTLQTVRHFPSIHIEMLTSCTPFVNPCSLSSSAGTPHLLCTAHTGTVLVYDVVSETVSCELEGHEFDAWCCAVMPTTTGAVAGVENDASSRDLLLSGGDDGLLKLYDMRAGYSACGRARFDAGVVHVAPVVATAAAGGEGAGVEVVKGATPYVLVGSYDASLSLVDTRFVKRPVAQRTGLGGGVWRCSRCLFPFYASSDAGGAVEGAGVAMSNLSLLESSLDPVPAAGDVGDAWLYTCGVSAVNEVNVLLLPLMQRGAALLAYNVNASEEEVFGHPQYFERGSDEDDNAEGESHGAAMTSGTVSKETLVYDATSLGVRREGMGDGGARYTARVATCSFYEKRIDFWTLRNFVK